MTDPMAEIRVTFFQECEEQLAELATGLISMENGTADNETVNAVFRAVHSMKGGAGIFALDQFVRFAHVFETALDKVRSGTLLATPPVVSVFQRAADVLEDVVKAAKENNKIEESRVDEITKLFESLDSNHESSSSEPDLDSCLQEENRVQTDATVWKIVFKPTREMYAKANESALVLRELGRLGKITTEIDLSQLPKLEELDPDGSYLSWCITLEANCNKQDIIDVFEFVEDDSTIEIVQEEAQEGFEPGTVIVGDNGFKFEFFGPMEPEVDLDQEPDVKNTDIHDLVVSKELVVDEKSKILPVVQSLAAKADLVASVGATIRVDLDRVDRMIDLVGELVINEAMLSQRVLEAGISRGSGVAMALDDLEHLTREIQDSVMAIRAQPVRSVFQRMPRLVREIAGITGKQVRLITEGEGTEVDKTVIERISDPLTHMIRNAIDHGLELPKDRIAGGKPAEGTVKLNAVHRSGRIVLEVSDDGAGINREVVRKKAIEKGLIAQDAQLSDEEIDNLIFLPGFSTAATISDISGRGVGMDVVRQSILALGGRISIQSKPGIGSTFTLSLPLTLAVLDGMVVSANGHTLIVPLGAIIETLKPMAKDVFPLDTDLRMLALRGGYVPIIDIAYCLGYNQDQIEADQGVALFVEGEGGVRAVLLVDAIHGQRQVVIKSLEANYRAVDGIAAATVMGDGRVALIVDVDRIVHNVVSDQNRRQIKNFEKMEMYHDK